MELDRSCEPQVSSDLEDINNAPVDPHFTDAAGSPEPSPLDEFDFDESMVILFDAIGADPSMAKLVMNR